MPISLDSLPISKGARKAFFYILHNQPATRAGICTALGVGAVSAGKYVQELLNTGMIKEEGYSESSGGRKPLIYAVNDTNHYILCINISTIYCEVAVSDFNLKLHGLRHFSIKEDDRPEAIVAKIWAVYNNIKEEKSLSDSSFIGAGVILFGTVKDSSGIMYRPIVQYMNDHWIDYPILDKLRNALPLQIFYEKGITALASLEYNYGVGKSCKSMIYVLCAMNIRSAYVLNGEVQGKTPFYEDAFGHMVVNYDGPHCKCGQYGCLNCYATIPAIIDEYKKRVKRGAPSSISGELDEVTIEAISKAAEDGEECARSVILDRARMLGIALANYIRVTFPDLVLLSGLLVELSPLYFDTAVAVAKDHLAKIDHANVSFSRIGSFSSPLTTSCASLVLESVFGDN